MSRYRAYLETSGEGACMAHVLELSGCFTRAATREAALARLPEAIRGYSAWQCVGGKGDLAQVEPLEIELAEENIGTSPFHPGDAAALFAPDRELATAVEMEDCFNTLVWTRADLLALARDLPDEVLDWQPDPKRHSLRRVLRHVGNAEKWYVPRVVAPECALSASRGSPRARPTAG